MRVLHVIQRYPPALGGAEGWCRGLARRQAARGDTVTVLATRAVTDDELWRDPPHAPTSCAVGPCDLDDGVRVVRCPVAPPLGPAGRRLLPRLGVPMLSRAHSPELYGRLLANAPHADVIHAHAVPGPHVFAARIVARIARRPFVLTPFLHPDDDEHASRAVGSVLRAAGAVVAMTRAEAGMLETRGVSRARIVGGTNALEPLDAPIAPRSAVRDALAIPSERPLLVFVGRKSASKGLDVLLDALGRVGHRPAPILVLVGPTTEWFRDLLAAHPAAVSVRDVPPLSEEAKAAVIGASDLLVLPSARESFGGVFLEAWRAGTPVVGADVPSVREVIGDAGALFRPGDAAALAVRIDEALDDPRGALAAAERGRARLGTEFTWTRVGTAVDAAYAIAGATPSSARASATRGLSWS